MADTANMTQAIAQADIGDAMARIQTMVVTRAEAGTQAQK